MTLSEIRTLVLSYLDDTNAGYFTTAQVNVWINNAQLEVQKKLIRSKQNRFIKCVQTTLVVNQNDYVLPNDFKDLNRLEVIISGTPPNENKSAIIPITMNQVDLVPNKTGTPQTYYFKKNRIVMNPAPDTALAMRLLYTYQIPSLTNDMDSPDFEEDYHPLVALLSAEDGFLKDGRSSELLVKKIKEFEEQLNYDAQERSLDVPRTVVETGFSGSGEYFW